MIDRRLIYMDESGDPGLAVGKGASPIFAVAAVIFESGADAEVTSERICAYRASLGKSEQFTFHFVGLRAAWRDGFLRAMSGCPFRVRAVVAEKACLDVGSDLATKPAVLYAQALRLLHLHELPDPRRTKVFIDGRDQTRELRKHLRGLGPVRFETKRNVLVQLADVAVGTLARPFYRPWKADSGTLGDLLVDRLERVERLGAKE